MNETGTILIIDTANNRIIEITLEKEIIWSYQKHLILPYEADLLENGHILIGNGVGNTVLEIDRSGKIVWSFGIPYYSIMYFLNILPLIGVFIHKFFVNWKQTKRIWSAKNARTLFYMGVLVWICILHTFFLSAIFDMFWNRNVVRLFERIFG